MKHVPVLTWLLGAFCIAWCSGVAAADEEGLPKGARLTPVAVVSGGAPNAQFLVGNYTAGSGRSGYWIWALDAKGERLWQRTFAAREQDQIVAAAPAGGGAMLVAGVVFVHSPLVGYRSWVRRVTERGDVGPAQYIGDYGKGAALVPAGENGWFLAGTGQRDPRAGMSDYDLWFVRFDGNGKVLWQRYADKGSSEAAVAACRLGDGGFAIVAGIPRQEGSNQSALWLLTCDSLGKTVAEVVIPGGRITSAEGSYLTATANGLAVIYSISSRTADGDALDITDDSSAGVRAARYDSSLKKLSETSLPEFPAVATPSLTTAPGGGFLVAGAFADGLRVEGFSADWKPQWEKKVKQDGEGFVAFRVQAAVVTEAAAFVAGSVSSPMNAAFGQSAFLLKIDPGRRTFDWVKMY